MNMQSIIEQVNKLPSAQQQMVADFIEFLVIKNKKTGIKSNQNWSESDFREFSFSQAMRGLEDEEELYDEKDLKEVWQ